MRKYLLASALGLFLNLGYAQDEDKASAASLAVQLSNPVASLISVPFQNNTDYGIGEFNGSRNTMNFQPVVPISLNQKWNLINRLVLPMITQYDITAPGAKENGLTDATVSMFVSPKEGKITWGVGPAFLVPTATDNMLGSDKWGVGPTAVVLKQTNGWTLGALANQIWSFAGDSDKPDVNKMFLQPFCFYNWQSGAGLGANMEMTQNWATNQTTIWLNPLLTGITSVGKQKISMGIGPRLNLAAPDGAKADWGWRAGIIFIFPK